MPNRATIAAIILAAGKSSRFTPGRKLVADFNGKPLARWTADAARGSRARPIVAVTGDARAEVEAAIGDGARFIHNVDYAEGMASSLRAGVAALPRDVGGALICLADMPFVTSHCLTG